MLQVQTSSGRSTNALQDSSQDNTHHQGRQKETPQEAERPGCPGRRPCPNRPQYPRRPTGFQRNSNRSMKARHGSSVPLPSSSSCFGPGLVIPLYYLPTPLSPNVPCHLSNRAATSHVVLCRQALWCISLLPHRIVLYSVSCNGFLSSPHLSPSPSTPPTFPLPRYLNTPSNLFCSLLPLGQQELRFALATTNQAIALLPHFHLVPVIPVSLSLSHACTLFLL